ncbi:MAG: EAL domain-containing protein, partial [Pygmaiobacter sp.]
YANRYHIAVIGEGVETREEMEALLACGVQYLQGYYLGYPSGELCTPSEKVQREICDFQQRR